MLLTIVIDRILIRDVFLVLVLVSSKFASFHKETHNFPYQKS